jgi:hypothetical protein
MARVIYKYPVNVGLNELKLSTNSDILKFGSQTVKQDDVESEQLFVWVHQEKPQKRNIASGDVTPDPDTTAPTYISIYPTGQECNHAPNQYIDTVIMNDGTVWHAFHGRIRD